MVHLVGCEGGRAVTSALWGQVLKLQEGWLTGRLNSTAGRAIYDINTQTPRVAKVNAAIETYSNYVLLRCVGIDGVTRH